MDNSEPCEVYSAANIQDAHMIKAVLEDAGIEARVVGENLQNAVGDLPAVAIAPRVWVKSEDFERSRAVIEDYLAKRRLRDATATEWICPECGEANEPTFEICWNCQFDRVE